MSMTQSITQVEALDWVAKLFEEPAGRLNPDTPRKEILAWDSLGTLTLMASLDSEFGIVIDDEHIQELQKVEDILELLRKHGRVC